MNSRAGSSLRPAFRQVLRLTPACDFQAVRQAADVARAWLASQGLPETELVAWELVLVEAGNNAVEHACPEAREIPLEMELSCGESDVEARVIDHTQGFEFPEVVELPDFDNEGGRGLFLIKSLTEAVAYQRGKGGNTLFLRKQRSISGPAGSPNLTELERKLWESDVALAEMAEELSSTYESLVAMFRYSAELGGSADLHEFSQRLVADLLKLTETHVAVIRLLDPQGSCGTFLTSPPALQESLPSLEGKDPGCSVELRALAEHHDIWFGAEDPLQTADPLSNIPRVGAGLVHPFGAGSQMLGTIALLRQGDGTVLRSAQVNLLHSFVDFLGIQIVNAHLLEERTRATVTRRELEIAANIQRSLLPPSLPQFSPFELAASSRSASEVGGDFYDVIPLKDRGVALVIADVMGKGVPAALFAAVLRNSLRSLSELAAEPGALLTSVNRTLCEDLARVDMFVTAQVVFLDFSGAYLISASAGHCPMLVWRPGDPAGVAVDDAGLPLGIESGCEYRQAQTPFPPGAIAALYTDGVTESRNPMDQMFGSERLAHFLPELSRLSGWETEARLALEQRCESYRQGAPLKDDQTLVLLRHRL